MTIRPIITLTTDFGLEDEYVGAVKGVLLSFLPSAQIVDITHAIDPQDVQGGSTILSRACGFFPDETVHLAVVDPGVGSARRLLAIKTPRYCFVGPDNGIFTAVLLSETTIQVHQIVNSSLFLSPVSRTFHGRDIMAPVAARLAGGMDISNVGPSIAIDTCCTLPVRKILVKDNQMIGEIVSRDRFGNLRTNISGEDIRKFARDRAITLKVGKQSTTRICSTYAEAESGDLIAVVDSFGFLEVSVACGNAWEEVGARVGDLVTITLQGGDL
jgi:S-adenosyl-L-methionine hydrolase (adenosine-forming)